MTEAEKKTLKAYEFTVECLEIELNKQLENIKMLKRSIDGFSELTKQQAEKIRIYEGRPKIPH